MEVLLPYAVYDSDNKRRLNEFINSSGLLFDILTSIKWTAIHIDTVPKNVFEIVR